MPTDFPVDLLEAGTFRRNTGGASATHSCYQPHYQNNNWTDTRFHCGIPFTYWITFTTRDPCLMRKPHYVRHRHIDGFATVGGCATNFV